jgi:hemerythrin-like domain-containing protein
MTTNSPENNFILARSQEHKLILETLGEMEACLKYSTTEELIGKLKSLIDKVSDNIARHQILEEKVIFAAALKVMPTDKVVEITTQLIKEHGIFEAAIASVKNLLFANCDGANIRKIIEKELQAIINQVKKHSLIEVRTLFPMLSANPQCKTVIDSLATKTQI